MLTYGFFGAGAREAMMLGKPVVCYLRDEWLDQMRAEILSTPTSSRWSAPPRTPCGMCSWS